MMNRWKWIGLGLVGLTGLGALAALLMYAYLEKDLPDIENLGDYKPPQTTKIYSDDGYLVAELYEERRVFVPLKVIPKHVVDAFLAAEDARFYDHEGLDYLGILRAAIKNLRPGAHLQGASTITQQTVKTLVLGPERSYWRKMREAILSRQLESMLDKEGILTLYLNQIYFGAGAYGVEEAARTYFGKSIRDVNLGEAALLAAIPKNPSHYTTLTDPKAARKRQRYVLEQMVAHAWATPEDSKRAQEAKLPPPPAKPTYLNETPHYVEWVKRELMNELGEEALRSGGYTVYTAMSAPMQVAAQNALRLGLEDVARRHGYPGARARIEVDRLEDALRRMHEWLSQRLEHRREILSETQAENVVWDLDRVSESDLSEIDTVLQEARLVELREDVRVDAVVVSADAVAQTITVDLGTRSGAIDFKTLAWARAFSPSSGTPTPKKPTDVLRPGDVVTVRVMELPEGKDSPLALELIPIPEAEGALVSIDQHSRYVRALVGGYTIEPGGLIRATQSRRQPGSAFKPIVYTAGITEQQITPASTCADTPIMIRDEWTGEAWKPENYEDGHYDGNITYRTALTKSKNTCSVKLIEKLGPQSVIATARSMGVRSDLPENLTLALGTGDVTPLELANAYAVLSSGGFLAEPIFIRKLVDRDGTVIRESKAELEQVIDPAAAYVVTQMMTSVVEQGTAQRAKVLERPLAGKTGTTNRSRNVWFSGFSPELTATVWIGFDDNRPLGGLTGSSGALPVWIRYMGRALAGVAPTTFEPPEDVVVVRVNPQTGEPTGEDDALDEVFIAGTEPTPTNRPLPSLYTEDDGEFAPY